MRIGDTTVVDKAEVRLKNLRKLVTEHEGMNNLARKLGMSKVRTFRSC